jgi:hypothetical protein
MLTDRPHVWYNGPVLKAVSQFGGSEIPSQTVNSSFVREAGFGVERAYPAAEEILDMPARRVVAYLIGAATDAAESSGPRAIEAQAAVSGLVERLRFEEEQLEALPQAPLLPAGASFTRSGRQQLSLAALLTRTADRLSPGYAVGSESIAALLDSTANALVAASDGDLNAAAEIDRLLGWAAVVADEAEADATDLAFR